MENEELDIIEYSEDISTAEAPKPIPAGTYPASIVSVTKKVSQNSGNEYLSIMFSINPDDFPPDFEDADSYADGAKLPYNRLTTNDEPRARYAMRRFCESIGVPASKKVDPTLFIGADCNVLLSHSTYEGEDRAQIDKVSS